MKILLITTHLNFGGISSYTLSLARKLKERGHTVITASAGGSLEPVLEEEGIEHIKLNIMTKNQLSPAVLFCAFKLGGLIKRENVDIVHAQTRVSQTLAFYLKKLTGRPYVTTSHGFFRPKLSRRIWPCWGSRVIAISDAVREHLVNDLGVAKDKIRLVYNGLDLDFFKRSRHSKAVVDIRKEYALSGGPVVGIIARLSSVKGHEVLLRAAGDILKDVPEAEFLIVGDGPERQKLLGLKEQLSLNKKVHFVPSVFDTTRPLAVMDVFALPSLQEGLGLSLLEAMACRVPVVASDVGGIYSVVEDGRTGYLVPPSNPAQLAAAICRLLKDEGLREKFGQAARKTVEDKFSLDKLIGQVEEVYQEAIDAG